MKRLRRKCLETMHNEMYLANIKPLLPCLFDLASHFAVSPNPTAFLGESAFVIASSALDGQGASPSKLAINIKEMETRQNRLFFWRMK